MIRIPLAFWFIATMLLLAGQAPGAEGVYPSADAVRPLAVGAQVPNAPVKTVRGASANLVKVVHDSGALLVFFRGGW